MTIIVFNFSRQHKTNKSFSTHVEHTSKSVPEVCLQDPRTENAITGYFTLTSPSFGSGLCDVRLHFSSFVSFYFIFVLLLTTCPEETEAVPEDWTVGLSHQQLGSPC